MKTQRGRTEVLSLSEDVAGTIRKFFTDEKKRVDVCAVDVTLNHPGGIVGMAEAYINVAKNGGRIRLLTEITKENLDNIELLMKTAEIRHLPGIGGNFVVSDTEYLATPGTRKFSLRGPILYSNEEAFVQHNEALFETLWMNAIPAMQRVRDIEAGFATPTTELHYDALQIQRLYADMVKQARVEILLLLPTANSFHRDERIGVIDLLRKAAEREVKVSLLAPTDPLIQRMFPAFEVKDEGNATSNPITYRALSDTSSRNTAKILIVDRSASLMIEERDPSKQDFAEAIGAATYTTSDPTVRSNIHFFERVRDETDQRVKEERSRKDAELMQDILAHDMTNYNQVIKLNAEVLEKKLGDEEARGFVQTILRAADGSSDLIQRAKTLSKVLSQDKGALHDVDLRQSLERTLSLVRESNPDRKVKTIPDLPEASVVADELLDEVFVNIFSNAFEYTDGTLVTIDLRLEQVDGPHENGGQRSPYWKVTITDHGRGIPDETKRLASRRHLESAKGSGLGLSIVRALVVDRYSGMLELRNRIQGDYTKGTSVEIWLPKAR
ncbi:MAG: ATP-binding protein [Nitrososphaerales archaeon]